MQIKQVTVEESLPLAETLRKNWLMFRQFIRLAMSDKPITRELDQKFLEVKSAITKSFSQLRTRLPRQVLGAQEKMQTVMKNCLSVTHVRNLPASDKRILYTSWHGFYMELCRASGALQYMQDEKYYPKFEEKEVKQSANIKANMMKEQAEEKKKK